MGSIKIRKRILQNKSGQAIVEYVLVLVISIFALIVIRKYMDEKFDEGMATNGGMFERQLRTTTLDPKAWER